MIARGATLVAAALLLVACGGDDGGRFDAQVGAVREAVDAGDREAALASLDDLQADAVAAHAEGDVADEELFELNALLDVARTQLDDELPEPTSTTTTESTTTTSEPPTTPAPAPVFDDDRDEGEEPKQKGKGKRGEDGGDDDD